MKKLQFVIVILCLALASCSTDNEQEPNTDGRQLRRLTIAEVPVTRAVLTDNTSSLSAVWKEGDKATYFNVTTFRENRMDTGLLTASENSITSAFTGSVYCETGDKVALFYPAQEVPTQGTNRGRFTINLDGQKGTLDDIAEHFHYVYGVAEVTSVTDNTASATIDNTKSMLALCKFSFTDGTSVIPVKTLTINYYDNNYCVNVLRSSGGSLHTSPSMSHILTCVFLP